MQNTLTIRKRAGFAAAALAVSAAGVLATVSPASAVVNGPEHVIAQALTPTSVKVTWTHPFGGEEPTYYVVIIDGPRTAADADTTPGVDDDYFEFVQPSSARTYTYATALPSTTYDVSVVASNEDSEGVTGPVTVTTPAPPVDTSTPPPAVGPFRPFYTVDAFITQNYLDWLGRAPRFDELTYWRTRLANNITIPNFLEKLRNEPTVDGLQGPMTRLYVAFFLRNPDLGGFDYWTNSMRNGKSIRSVADFFASSSEFENTYGAFDDAEFVALVYRNVLGRNPDSAGFSFWTRQLQNGLSRGHMMLGFSESPEYKRQTDKAVFAAEVYYAMLERMPTPGEYDAITFLGTTYRTDIYATIMNSGEYAGRVDTGFPVS